jgi:hypothetical protein
MPLAFAAVPSTCAASFALDSFPRPRHLSLTIFRLSTQPFNLGDRISQRSGHVCRELAHCQAEMQAGENILWF